MKVGLIARGEDRGLGTLTREFARHMRPERTLLVIPDGVRDAGLVTHVDWFDQPTCVRCDGTLNEQVCREWLDGLDVVYTAETFYDWSMVGWARDAGVRTVCHVMPEYFRTDVPPPDQWWNPTPYRQAHLPDGTRVVPVPIATDRFEPKPLTSPPFTWLHVGGARAPADRNGTLIFLQALEHLTEEHHAIVRVQGERIAYPQCGSRVRLDVHTTPAGDYWRNFDEGDVMVMPRRYGGLSLPVNEAMAAGMAVVMPKVAPNLWWPVIPVDAMVLNYIQTSAGEIPIAQTEPKELAALMDGLARNPEPIIEARAAARAWAYEHSWETLRPVIENELAAVCV